MNEYNNGWSLNNIMYTYKMVQLSELDLRSVQCFVSSTAFITSYLFYSTLDYSISRKFSRDRVDFLLDSRLHIDLVVSHWFWQVLDR